MLQSFKREANKITREEIGRVLKNLRLASGKTQKEVAEQLGRKQQIVGHWETGYSQPDANTLFTLCDIYGTTVDEAFGFKKNGVRLSKDDISWLKMYQNLDPHGKEIVDVVLEKEYARWQSEHSQPDVLKDASSCEVSVLAAHARTDKEPTSGGQTHDPDIMFDDKG